MCSYKFIGNIINKFQNIQKYNRYDTKTLCINNKNLTWF